MTAFTLDDSALVHYAAFDLAENRLDDARGKIGHLLANAAPDSHCDLAMVRVALFLAKGAIPAAHNQAHYMQVRWGAERAAAALAALTAIPGTAADWRNWLPRDTADPAAAWARLLHTLETAVRDLPPSAPWVPHCDGDKPLVVVGMSGGLGNQLFQYGAGLAWARRCGGELRIDTRFYREVVREDRRFWLHHFNVDVQHPSEDELRRVAHRRHEQDLCVLDNTVLTGTGDVHLAGFWPSHIYIEQAADELRAAYTQRNPHVTAYARAYVQDLRRHGRVVAVHVRRGDNTLAYNRNSYLLHHVEYYRQAARRMGEDCVFLVFSDTNLDLEWCRRRLDLLPGARVEFAENHSFLFDFALMSECDDHIISVSSFSWWAAWLARRPGQRVIMAAPEQGTGITGSHYRQWERALPDWEILTMPPELCL